MDSIDHIDVLMTRAPHPDGEFVETEDPVGRSCGSDRGLGWYAPTVESPYWRLRIPASAYGVPPRTSTPVTWPGAAVLLMLCATVVAVVWLLTR